jgi:c-di-GMP-binding flagellar brake protein YcgR
MSELPSATSSEPVPERRREYRLNRVLGAELVQGEMHTKARLYVINISSTGLKATHPTPLSTDELQRFLLELSPKEPPLDLKARIAWQRELTMSGLFEVGLEFVELSEENKRHIESFIETERNKKEPSKSLDLASIWKFGQLDGI